MQVPLRLGQMVILERRQHKGDLWCDFAASVANFNGIRLHRFLITEDALRVADDGDSIDDANSSVWLSRVLSNDSWPVLVLRTPKTGPNGLIRMPESVIRLAYDLKLTHEHRQRPNILRDSDGTVLAYLIHSRDQAIDLIDSSMLSGFRLQSRINTPDERLQILSPVDSLQQASPETLYEVTRYPNPSRGSVMSPDVTDTSIRHHIAMLRSVQTPFIMTIEPTVRITTKIVVPDTLSNEIIVYSCLNPYNGLVYHHGGPVIYPVSLRNLDTANVAIDDNFLTWSAVTGKLKIRTNTTVVAVNNYAPPTPSGRVRGIVTAYQEAYRLQRILLGLPPFSDYANRFIDSGYSTPGQRPVDHLQRSLTGWLDSDRYATTFKYQCRAAQLGQSHARRAAPTPINSYAWLHHIIEQINAETN